MDASMPDERREEAHATMHTGAATGRGQSEFAGLAAAGVAPMACFDQWQLDRKNACSSIRKGSLVKLRFDSSEAHSQVGQALARAATGVGVGVGVGVIRVTDATTVGAGATSIAAVGRIAVVETMIGAFSFSVLNEPRRAAAIRLASSSSFRDLVRVAALSLPGELSVSAVSSVAAITTGVVATAVDDVMADSDCDGAARAPTSIAARGVEATDSAEPLAPPGVAFAAFALAAFTAAALWVATPCALR